jgi:hypothetical protein
VLLDSPRFGKVLLKNTFMSPRRTDVKIASGYEATEGHLVTGTRASGSGRVPVYTATYWILHISSPGSMFETHIFLFNTEVKKKKI